MASAAPAAAAAASGSEAAPLPLTLSRPLDDLHLHVRDGEVLDDMLEAMLTRPYLAHARHAPVARALLMPNLQPPVTTAQHAEAYRQRVMQALGRVEACRQAAYIAARGEEAKATPLPPLQFTPLMSLYLTDATTPEHIREAQASGVVACKLYPQGATTHSSAGVTDVLALVPTFKSMAECGLLLLVHGESTDPSVDIFDREAAFLPTLGKVLESVPELRVVLEHVSTGAGVRFVSQHAARGARVAATITVHHLLLNRNALFAGGMNPAIFCLPVLKHEEERQALWDALLGPRPAKGAAAASGASAPSIPDSPFLFAGTDSAPHPRANKEKACGCAAGAFTSHATPELYAEAFEAAAAERGVPREVWQRRLERFLCEDGAKFYGMTLNEPRPVVLEKQSWTVPQTMPFGSTTLIPLRAGQSIAWRLRAEA